MRQLAVVMAMFLGWAVSGSAAAAPSVTGQQCVECHDSESKTHAYHGDCASCHSNAEAHATAEEASTVKVGGPDSKQCLTCHAGDHQRMNFTFAEHNRAGVQCADCHGMHSSKVKAMSATLEKADRSVALCATCHQDVVVKLGMRSHHPVKEGGLACVDCHDPHAGKNTGRDAAFVAKTAQCTQCHQAVRGPHAFEHPPAAEDCTSCHDPHGSPNRKMLSLAQPMLCLQCHSVAGNRHGAAGTGTNNQPISAAALRNCSSCHSAPHGSHMDQHLRF